MKINFYGWRVWWYFSVWYLFSIYYWGVLGRHCSAVPFLAWDTLWDYLKSSVSLSCTLLVKSQCQSVMHLNSFLTKNLAVNLFSSIIPEADTEDLELSFQVHFARSWIMYSRLLSSSTCCAYWSEEKNQKTWECVRKIGKQEWRKRELEHSKHPYL